MTDKKPNTADARPMMGTREPTEKERELVEKYGHMFVERDPASFTIAPLVDHAPAVEPEPDVDAAMLAAGFDKRIETGQATEFPVSGKQNEANEPTCGWRSPEDGAVPCGKPATGRLSNSQGHTRYVCEEHERAADVVGYDTCSLRDTTTNITPIREMRAFDEGIEVGMNTERARIERIIEDRDWAFTEGSKADLLAAIRGGDVLVDHQRRSEVREVRP